MCRKKESDQVESQSRIKTNGNLVAWFGRMESSRRSYLVMSLKREPTSGSRGGTMHATTEHNDLSAIGSIRIQ